MAKRKPESIRAAILRRMEERGLNANKLALLVADDVSRAQVFRFLAGTHDATTEVADVLLRALDLRIAPK